MPHNELAGSTCWVESCDRPRARTGKNSHARYCFAHLARWQKHGDVQESVPIRPRTQRIEGDTCTVEGCERPRRVTSMKGETLRRAQLCSGHSSRVVRYGDVLADIPLRETGRLRPKS